jgi:SAM-dependent methyltransferase
MRSPLNVLRRRGQQQVRAMPDGPLRAELPALDDPQQIRATVESPAPPWLRLLRECQQEIAEVGMHPHYARAYRAEEFHYWSHVPKWIDEDARTNRPARCLDVGCAYGTLLLFTKRLTGCEAYGIDFMNCFMNPAMVAKHGLRHAVCNIELAPCPFAGPFDVILFTEVLEHFNFRCVPTLEKLAGLLAPDGRLYLTTPDASEWGRVNKYYASCWDMPPPSNDWKGEVVDDHVWQFNITELIGCVLQAGLRIVRLEYSPGVLHRHFNLTLVRA